MGAKRGCKQHHCPHRAYVPATWSLARLDALADEVTAILKHGHKDNDVESAPPPQPLDTVESDPERIASNSESTTSASGDTGRQYLQQVRAYPMQTIDAVNQVLFIQQGYQCIAPEPGDPRQVLPSLPLCHRISFGGHVSPWMLLWS